MGPVQEYKIKIDTIIDRLPRARLEELLDYATYLSTKYSVTGQAINFLRANQI